MSKVYLIFILFLSCRNPETKELAREQNKGNTVSTNYENQNNNNETQNGYKVIGIKDGDTFVLLMDRKEQVVRLSHIDCPEKKQAFGSQAKQFVSKMCFEKYVTLIHNNKFDKNKRLIAEVFLQDGTNINKELIKNGLAWHFKKYSTNKEYAALELLARQKKIGLWLDNKPIAPWEWRK